MFRSIKYIKSPIKRIKLPSTDTINQPKQIFIRRNDKHKEPIILGRPQSIYHQTLDKSSTPRHVFSIYSVEPENKSTSLTENEDNLESIHLISTSDKDEIKNDHKPDDVLSQNNSTEVKPTISPTSTSEPSNTKDSTSGSSEKSGSSTPLVVKSRVNADGWPIDENDKPLEPEPWECCGNDCPNCVWIQYDEQLGNWKDSQKKKL